jgi:hypothetical protein
VLADAHIPGLLGFAAFVVVKFAGYMLAGMLLKHFHPEMQRKPWQIATMRTVLGVIFGPILALLVIPYIDDHVPRFDSWMAYFLMVILRLFVWSVVVFWALRNVQVSRGRRVAYVLAGVLWSCLLDIPGFFLAEIAPGRISIC